MKGFASITLRLPVAEPPVHAFYTMVSWLYVMIVESGPIHFRFLSERAAALGLDRIGQLDLFRKDIQTFRTVLQHNLNLPDPADYRGPWPCSKTGSPIKAGVSPARSHIFQEAQSNYAIVRNRPRFTHVLQPQRRLRIAKVAQNLVHTPANLLPDGRREDKAFH